VAEEAVAVAVSIPRAVVLRISVKVCVHTVRCGGVGVFEEIELSGNSVYDGLAVGKTLAKLHEERATKSLASEQDGNRGHRTAVFLTRDSFSPAPAKETPRPLAAPT